MRMQRTPILTVLAFAAAGVAIGLLLQLTRSAQGSAPLVPPVSLAATLLVIAAVLVVLAVLLRRAVSAADGRRASGRRVNPFHAVRLLAGARAGQFAGALFAGFGGGSLLQLLTRSVMAPAGTWVPMMLVLISGVILMICGIIAELLCRVPPQDPENDAPGNEPEITGEAGFMQ